MDERDVWKISVVIEATHEQADVALEAIARVLCPDEHHPGYCPVPWTTILCRFSELDDEERGAWREELDAYRLRANDEAIQLIVKDLVATLGWTPEEATDVVHRAGSPIPSTLMGMAEDAQQWLHDTFLDTTWPPCPDHGRHPLWLADAQPLPVWTCEESGRSVCSLGELGTVIKIDDSAARANRKRLAANTAADVATMEQFRRPR